MDSISEAQFDIREAEYGGGPGVIASGTVWLIAGIVSYFDSSVSGIITLIIGGMFIFPLGILFCKIAGASGKLQKGNPLFPLAIEGTIWMVISIPIAVGVAFHRIEWFFPAMIFVIAGRYFTFSSLYGIRLFWAFSVVLIISGWALVLTSAPVFIGALTGGLIEYCFGVALFIHHKSKQPNKALKAADAKSGAA
jgi:hypothetical protein